MAALDGWTYVFVYDFAFSLFLHWGSGDFNLLGFSHVPGKQLNNNSTTFLLFASGLGSGCELAITMGIFGRVLCFSAHCMCVFAH